MWGKGRNTVKQTLQAQEGGELTQEGQHYTNKDLQTNSQIHLVTVNTKSKRLRNVHSPDSLPDRLSSLNE